MVWFRSGGRPGRPNDSHLGSLDYWISRNAPWGVLFAWANIAVPACTRMLNRANLVLSSATSTSTIRLLAEERLSRRTESCSEVWDSRAMFAPKVARSVVSCVIADFTLLNAVTAAPVEATPAPVAVV